MIVDSEINMVAADKNSPDCNTFVQIEVYDRFERLQEIQPEWDQLVESLGSEIFLTYDWCRIWWKYYGGNRHLRIFFFRRQKELVGIVPLFFEKIWLGPMSGRVGKIVGSDFTMSHFTLPLSSDCLDAIMKAFTEAVSKEKWDLLHIGPLAGMFDDAEKIAILCRTYLGPDYVVKREENAVQTYFRLACSWEEQLTELSKNQRKKFKKNEQIIQDDEKCVTAILANREDFAELFEDFVEMHQSRWVGAGRGGHFGDWPNAYEFHRDVAVIQLKHNRLKLMKVKLDEDVVGYKYGYQCGDKHCAFLDARLETSPIAKLDLGKILFEEQVKNVLKENRVEYIDSMRGRYEHKQHLGGVLYPMRDIYVVPKKLSVMIRVSLFRTLAWFLNLCYYRIWYCRLAHRLPFKHRPLWKMWIRSYGFSRARFF